MAVITAANVKELRERTGAGMMDAKKALTEADGDIEAAVDALRAKGLATAQKKSSRTAAEGLVGIQVEGLKGVAVEVNSETDFVAKNEQFQDFVRKVTSVAMSTGDDVDTLKAAPYPDGETVGEKLTNSIATIGENQSIRRIKTVSVAQGAVVSYMHNAVAPNLGKIGVLVALEGDVSADILEPLGKQIGMHIAAAFPLALNSDGLDAEMIARERKIAEEKAAESGKQGLCPLPARRRHREGRNRLCCRSGSSCRSVRDPAPTPMKTAGSLALSAVCVSIWRLPPTTPELAAKRAWQSRNH